MRNMLYILGCLTILLLVSCGDSSTGNDSDDGIINSREMVLVEGGTFMMGCRDSLGEADEYPLHEVTVSDFYIGKYEVTQALWVEIYGEVPAGLNDSIPNWSAFGPSWYQALEFLNALSLHDGYEPCYNTSGSNIVCDFTKNGYRFPTEAEWEFAARGGNLSQGYIYAGSNDHSEVCAHDSDYTVGRLAPNELGLYDMSGNKSEHCWDRYASDYYQQCLDAGVVVDPKGPDTSTNLRIFRGGGQIGQTSELRVSTRKSDVYVYGSHKCTTRLVRTAQ